MKVKSFILTSVTAVVLSSSLSALANNPKVTCPSMELVKQSWQKLNTVARIEPNSETFAVYSDEPLAEENGLTWLVTTGVIEKGFDTAFNKAQNLVKNLSHSSSQSAIDGTDMFICNYENGPQGAIATIGFKDYPNNFKLASFRKTFNRVITPK